MFQVCRHCVTSFGAAEHEWDFSQAEAILCPACIDCVECATELHKEDRMERLVTEIMWKMVLIVLVAMTAGVVAFSLVHAGDYDSPYSEPSSSLGRSGSSYSGSDYSISGYSATGSGGVVTIQPPVGLPSHAYTSPSGITTIHPPVGLPTTIYPGNPATIQPPVGLPGYIYGR